MYKSEQMTQKYGDGVWDSQWPDSGDLLKGLNQNQAQIAKLKLWVNGADGYVCKIQATLANGLESPVFKSHRHHAYRKVGKGSSAQIDLDDQTRIGDEEWKTFKVKAMAHDYRL